MISLRPFTLRIAIQSIFLSIFVILVGVIILLSTIEYSKSIEIFSKKAMDDSATHVMDQFGSQLRPADLLIKLTKLLMEKDLITQQQLIDYAYVVAKSLPPYIYKNTIRISVWGDPEGNSIATALEADGTYSTEILKPNKTPPTGIKLYRDLEGNIIKRERVPVNYDPRTRPWYIAAQNAKKPIWTKLYLSFPYKHLTITTAIPIYNKQQKLLGIFQLELKMIGLANFLTSVKVSPHSHTLILNASDELFAYEDIQKDFVKKSASEKIEVLKASGYHELITALQLYNKTHQSYFRFKSNGQTFLAYFKPIPKISYTGLKIGIVVAQNDFTSRLKKANTIILIATLVILCFGILLTRFFSRLISHSLDILVKDTGRIKDFNLDDKPQISSHIYEISFLANAMESMKSSLRAFKKFVPTDLVRQLIQSGEGVEIGGVSKNISTFFTDIRNFTTISESMEPEKLMHHLCDYFEQLSNIIASEKGTVDKYIGDSIMAFWGAPIDDEEHCFHACNTALRCKERLEELNLMWEKQNKPPLITSIGVHTGKAIVGNIGSSTRLNYTAIGDTINFTSRLELQSKKHGSIIIVSEAVVNAVKEQFIFRFIETAEIRGKTGTYNIYELVSKKTLS